MLSFGFCNQKQLGTKLSYYEAPSVVEMLIILRLLANFGWGVLELPTLKSRCIILANDLGVRVKGHSKNVCQNKTGGGGG